MGAKVICCANCKNGMKIEESVIYVQCEKGIFKKTVRKFDRCNQYEESEVQG